MKGLRLILIVPLVLSLEIKKNDPVVMGSGEMFDTIANYYDLANKILSLGLDKYWRIELVKKLEIKGTERILDLATGTADVAILLGKELQKDLDGGGSVVGIDPSRNMLIKGTSKIIEQNLHEIVTLKQGDAQYLHLFQNRSFDIITMSFGVRNVPNKLLALTEMRRVIRDSNRYSKVAILEFSQPSSGALVPISTFFINYFVPSVGSILGFSQEYDHLRKSIFEFPSPENFVSLMETAGFTRFQPMGEADTSVGETSHLSSEL